MNFQLHRLGLSIGFFLSATSVPLPALASPNKDARITEVMHDVQLSTPDGAVHAAVANEKVHEGMIVRTGAASQVALTFADQTVARLGANTAFDFKDGTRN